MEEAGKYGDHVRLVLAILAFPPPHLHTHNDSTDLTFSIAFQWFSHLRITSEC